MSAELQRAYAGAAVCVTGGAGFIGSHLCDALVHHDARVTAIDDLSSGRRQNLAASADRVTLVEGSILDTTALRAAMSGASIVFHLAAVASVPRSVREPELYHRVNTTGTQAVLEAARAAAPQARVIYASSSSAYGEQPGQPRRETMPPDPRSPYAASKCAGEYLVRAYACCYGLPCLSLRYFNIFGPRQRADSPYAAVIPRFVESLRAGKAPVVYGDGTQTRDFTFVANAVHANLLAGALPLAQLDGGVVNVAAGQARSVLDLLKAVATRLGVPPRCEHAPARPGEVQHSRASLDRARAVLGYEPLVSFEEGLDETVRGFSDRTFITTIV